MSTREMHLMTDADLSEKIRQTPRDASWANNLSRLLREQVRRRKRGVRIISQQLTFCEQ